MEDSIDPAGGYCQADLRSTPGLLHLLFLTTTFIQDGDISKKKTTAKATKAQKGEK
ncbi:hypothetical protein AGMMS50267_10060 [Spirochaetia bacterium]|nr:hypothetical protein AGMMS50267_10060 [Spirochaetia bacterium]